MSETALFEYEWSLWTTEKWAELQPAARSFDLLLNVLRSQALVLDREPDFSVTVSSLQIGGVPTRVRATEPARRAIVDLSLAAATGVASILRPKARERLRALDRHLRSSDLALTMPSREQEGIEACRLGSDAPRLDFGPVQLLKEYSCIVGTVASVGVERPRAYFRVAGQARLVPVRLSLEQARWIAHWISRPGAGRVKVHGTASYMLPGRRLLRFQADPEGIDESFRESSDAVDLRDRLRNALIPDGRSREWVDAMWESVALRSRE